MLLLSSPYQELVRRTDPKIVTNPFIEIRVTPCKLNNAVIIIYPGFNTALEGVDGKYNRLASFLANDHKVASVIQMPNQITLESRYALSVINDLKAVIEHTLNNSDKFCVGKPPDIFLMGHSAGASAVAAVCSSYSQIKKILLVAPSGDAASGYIRENLDLYTGELYSVAGSNDEVVGSKTATTFAKMACSACVNIDLTIDRCDHNFSSEFGQRILSSLPLWAFTDLIAEPSANAGIALK